MPLVTHLKAGVGVVSSLSMPFGTSTTSTTIDAAGELQTVLGQVRLSSGVGTSKTISSSGYIIWTNGSVTFANAGTTFKVGIQDVNLSTGYEDGTYDVYGTMTGGTDTINASQLNRIAMSSGSKTITDGDLVAIVFELTARGGSDSLQIRTWSGNSIAGSRHFPYGTRNLGTPAKIVNGAVCAITFDDGTIGWIEPFNLTHDLMAGTSNVTYDSADSPDEYAAIFEVPYPMRVRTFALGVSNITSGDDWELILYKDAYGAPVAIKTEAQDPDLSWSSAEPWPYFWMFDESILLAPNIYYALAARPTTGTNPIRFLYQDLTATFAGLKACSQFPTIAVGSRSDQSGAFSEVSANYLPILQLFPDAVGGVSRRSIRRF